MAKSKKSNAKNKQPEQKNIDNTYLGSLRFGNGLYAFQQRMKESMSSKTETYQGPVIEPNLAMELSLISNTLEPCINVMANNVHRTGYTLEPKFDMETASDSLIERAEAEKVKLETIINYVNEEYSLEELRYRSGYDKELFGYSFIELIRKPNGELLSAFHLPSQTITISSVIRNVRVDVDIDRGQGKKTRTFFKDFKVFKYSQNNDTGDNGLYFIEAGYPGKIDRTTGKPFEEHEDEPGSDKDVAGNRLAANEIYFDRQYSPSSPYGVPKWYTQLPSIMGSRRAELINLDLLRKNMIPTLLMLIGGGSIDEQSLTDLRRELQSRADDNRNHYEPLILNATGSATESMSVTDTNSAIPTVTLEQIKPFGDDLLFQEYDSNTRNRIRAAFRIPKILLGWTEDFNRATADTSIIIAEAQVFEPERRLTDSWINKYILGNGIDTPKYWCYKSKPTALMPNSDTTELVQSYAKLGALTINQLIDVINQTSGLEIPRRDDHFGNMPASVVSKIGGSNFADLDNLKLLMEGDIGEVVETEQITPEQPNEE